MNHIYRSIWSESLSTWIAVSESTKTKGKHSSMCRKLLATGLLLCSSSGWALPTGEQVVAGQVTVTTPNAAQMQINQGSQQAIVNWQGFSINPNEAVNIQQPNASATLLNRVVGMDASIIQGQLNANGQVYLVNPNGVLFSKTAQVDVGGLIATTHNISNADFLNGNWHFTQDNAIGTISNQGYIKTPEGGVVALIGTQVSNEGTIETPKGSAILAAGKTIDLDFKGDGLVEVKVPETALNAQLENKGAILADGGRVVLSAQAAGKLTDTVLNSEGLVQAKSLLERNGEIILDGGNNGVTQVSGTLDASGQTSGKITVTGKNVNINVDANLTAQTSSSDKAGTIKVLGDMDDGVVNVVGKLDASAPDTGDGGFIETSAAKVKIADTAKVTTKSVNGNSGTWLIDPVDITIASDGNITGANLGFALNNGNVILNTSDTGSCTGGGALCSPFTGTNGDINVTDAVSWSTNNTLTLIADRNINIHANITGSGTSSKLALQYALTDSTGNYSINNGTKVFLPAGQNFSTQKGFAGAVKNYTVITDLGAETDATTASSPSTTLQGMAKTGNLSGFYALGADIDANDTGTTWSTAGFTPIGRVTTPFTGSFEGLGHSITNLSINRPTTNNIGLFSTTSAASVISNVSIVGGSISGLDNVGALVGKQESGTIINSNASSKVTGERYVGGLIGRAGSKFTANILNSYATDAAVTGIGNVGGLVGGQDFGNISNSYATTNVTGTGNNLGGLVGQYSGTGTINLSHAAGNVTGSSTSQNIGGLVGLHNASGDVSNNYYSTGTVSGNRYVGGLIGREATANILNSYAKNATVQGNGNVGGLVGGQDSGDISNSYASANVIGTGNNLGGLVGQYLGDGIINLSHAAGKVTGSGTSQNVGGLIGEHNATGEINNNYYAIGAVSGFRYVGGLIGRVGRDFTANIFNSHAKDATVTGAGNVGGLVGGQDSGNISNSYATTNVTGTGNNLGGLVGQYLGSGTINSSYAAGNVTGSGTGQNVGGLIGLNNTTGDVSNNYYAIGAVSGTRYVGGLIGRKLAGNVINNYAAATTVTGVSRVGGLVGGQDLGNIINTYATSNVNNGVAALNVGGLVGANGGTVSNSFWDMGSTGQIISAGGVGLTTTEMKVSANFNSTTIANGNVNPNWSISNTGGSSAVWRIYEGNTTPLLRSFLTTLLLTDITDASKIYNGDSQSGEKTSIGGVLGTAASGKNVGFYNNGYYSNQQGYDIVGGSLTITPANYTQISGIKTYDGTTTFTNSNSTLLLKGVGSESFSVSADANSKDAVTASKFDSVSNITDDTANGWLANNYSTLDATALAALTANNKNTAVITPASLTIIANNANKFYDGTTYSGGNGVTYVGFANGESQNDVPNILTGSLSYGGNSQGAINAGTYNITPQGLSAENYKIIYRDGTLNIINNSLDNSLDNTIAGIIKPLPSDTGGTEQLDSAIEDITDDFVGNPIKKGTESLIQPILTIKNSAGRVKQLQMSSNRQFLSLLLEDGSVRVWDFQRGMQRQIVMQNQHQSLTDISAVDNKGELMSIASKAGIGAYDVISSSADASIKEPDITHFVTSNDGSLLLLNAGTNDITLWDNKQNQKLWQFPYQRGTVSGLALTDNKQYAAVLSRTPNAYLLPPNLQLKRLTDGVEIVDIETGKIIKSLPNLGEEIIYMQFKDNNTLQIGLSNGEMLNWPITNEKPKRVVNFSEPITAIDTEKNIYTYVRKDGTVRVVNDQGQVMLSIKNKENPAQQALLLEDGKQLLTVLASGDLSLWDISAGKKMLRLFSSRQGWTVMDAFGRFDGSEESLENFTWLANEEDIPLDNFSENYYEPGLLANVVQNQDYLNDALNSVKNGIHLPPKVNIQLADQQTAGNNVTLQLDIYDRGGGINKVQIYHNGKALNNDNVILAQKSLQENNNEHRILTLNVTPIAGKNTLKAVTSNEMGIENSSPELSFDGKTKAYTSAIRFLSVGINQYSDQNLNLSYSVADAQAIGETLNNYSKVAASKSLYNENATKPKILAELKELSQGAQQDVLVIYFAGHGIAAGKEWYFLPHETRLYPTLEKITATGITATELSDIFKYSKIQHILLIVDACYSGAGMDAFGKLQNGQRYFSRQLSRSLGITVVTATAKNQEASELKSLGHGLFTYLITQELQKKDATEPVTAHSIAKKVVKALPIFSKKLIGISQDPAAYTHGSDFILTNLLKEPATDSAASSTPASGTMQKNSQKP